MAGNLFPETYIGDSEEVYKKVPGRKEKNPPLSRDLQPASPPRGNAGQQNCDHGAGAGELNELSSQAESHPYQEADGTKEDQPVARGNLHDASDRARKQQNLQYSNLDDFNWVEKDGKEKGPQGGNSGSPPVARSSPEEPDRAGGCNGQEVLWPPPGDATQERLEPRLNEVSLIDSFVTEETLPMGTGRSTPGGPDSRLEDLYDEEDPPGTPSASTGYFPCYRTYGELPRYHPPGAERQLEGTASCRDASVQCGRPKEATGGDRKKAEANSNCKGVKGSPRQPQGGSRPDSAGRKRDGSARDPRPHSGGSPEGTPKTRSSRSSPTRPGAAREEPVSCPRASPSPPPGKTPAQKKKHRASPVGEKEPSDATERKPLLADLRSLPPSPEEKAGALPLCCYGAQAAGENQQVRPLKEQREEKLTPDISPAPDLPEEPRPTPSRLSFHAIVSWVWRIFRKPPMAPPATAPGTEAIRRPLAQRMRRWLTQRRNRVHPEPP